MLIGIFFIAFMIIMVIIAIGASLINGVLSFILSPFRGRKHHGHDQQARQSNHQSQAQQTTSSAGKKREKIFDKNDGEYVDFEEIKE